MNKDTLLKIFEFLPWYNAIKLSETSKLWYQVSHSFTLWEKMLEYYNRLFPRLRELIKVNDNKKQKVDIRKLFINTFLHYHTNPGSDYIKRIRIKLLCDMYLYKSQGILKGKGGVIKIGKDSICIDYGDFIYYYHDVRINIAGDEPLETLWNYQIINCMKKL